MSLYVIIGIIALAIICIYMVMQRKKSDDKSKKKKSKKTSAVEEGMEPTEAQLIEMEKRLQEILAYDLADEEKITAMLPDMSIEEMAKYADKVTLKNINDKQFLDAFVPEDLMEKLNEIPFDIEEEKFMILNPTVLGNLSYISLNADEPHSSRAKNAVQFLKTKF